MPVSKEQAIEIARNKFERSRRKHRSKYGLKKDCVLAHFRRGGYGTDYMGMGEAYWMVCFQLDLPPTECIDPDDVTVFVDAQSGKSKFFPTI